MDGEVNYGLELGLNEWIKPDRMNSSSYTSGFGFEFGKPIREKLIRY